MVTYDIFYIFIRPFINICNKSVMLHIYVFFQHYLINNFRSASISSLSCSSLTDHLSYVLCFYFDRCAEKDSF